jgi:hypothetical protein
MSRMIKGTWASCLTHHQCRSWGSGRWMYTWKAKTINNWNTKQTYSATRVQHTESNISRKWSIVGDVRLDPSRGSLLKPFFYVGTNLQWTSFRERLGLDTDSWRSLTLLHIAGEDRWKSLIDEECRKRRKCPVCAQRKQLERREGDGRWWLKWMQLWAMNVDGEVLHLMMLTSLVELPPGEFWNLEGRRPSRNFPKRFP